MSNIACPQCGATVAGSAVNLATLVARCDACDHVFRFDGQLAPPRDTISALATKPALFVVTGGDVISSDDGTYRTAPTSGVARLVVQWRWFTPQAIFTLLFALAWDAFLVFWYGLAIAKGGPWIMFVFPLAHVGVGVLVTYGALSKLLNTTAVTVEANELRCVTSPIRNPFRPNVALPIDALAELEVVDKRGKTTSYEVIARDGGGRTHRLGVFDARREADYLASLIRRQLVRVGHATPLLGATVATDHG